MLVSWYRSETLHLCIELNVLMQLVGVRECLEEGKDLNHDSNTMTVY
jgi:hypothetical protein